jgi:hypothetical protein
METIKSTSTSWKSLMRLTYNNFMALLVVLTILASNNNNTNAPITVVGTTPPSLALFQFFLLLLLLQLHLLAKVQLDSVRPLLCPHTILTFHLF